jgi:morphogenetic protein associated with SpoVID
VCYVNPSGGNGVKIHIVKQGDTLYLIAQKYNVSLEDIVKANPEISNPDAIDVGMKVKIPSQPKTALEVIHHHIVQQGDSLWKLSKAWGIQLADMIKANPQLKNPNALLTGEVVNIPKTHNGSISPEASMHGQSNHAQYIPGKVNTGIKPGTGIMPKWGHKKDTGISPALPVVPPPAPVMPIHETKPIYGGIEGHEHMDLFKPYPVPTVQAEAQAEMPSYPEPYPHGYGFQKPIMAPETAGAEFDGYGYEHQHGISPLEGNLAGNLGGLYSHHDYIGYGPNNAPLNVISPAAVNLNPVSGCKTCGGPKPWPSTLAENTGAIPYTDSYPGMGYQGVSPYMASYGFGPHVPGPYAGMPQAVSPAGIYPGAQYGAAPFGAGPYAGMPQVSPQAVSPVGIYPGAQYVETPYGAGPYAGLPQAVSPQAVSPAGIYPEEQYCEEPYGAGPYAGMPQAVSPQAVSPAGIYPEAQYCEEPYGAGPYAGMPQAVSPHAVSPAGIHPGAQYGAAPFGAGLYAGMPQAVSPQAVSPAGIYPGAQYGAAPYGAGPYAGMPQAVSPAGIYPGAHYGSHYGMPMANFPVGVSPVSGGFPGFGGPAGYGNVSPAIGYGPQVEPYFGAIPSIPALPSMPPLPPLSPLAGGYDHRSDKSEGKHEVALSATEVKKRHSKPKPKLGASRQSKPKHKESLPWIKW